MVCVGLHALQGPLDGSGRTVDSSAGFKASPGTFGGNTCCTPDPSSFVVTQGYCRAYGNTDANTDAYSGGSVSDEACQAICSSDSACVAFDNCGDNGCWLHRTTGSTGTNTDGCSCHVKSLSPPPPPRRDPSRLSSRRAR